MYQPKNILQEALQKRKFPVPVYTYGPSSWGFKCTLYIQAKEALTFTAHDRSKVLSSNAAAEEAIKYLDIHSTQDNDNCTILESSSLYIPPESPIGYILLDLESVQLSELSGIPREILANVSVMGFMSEYHHSFTNSSKVSGLCQLFTVKSTQKDVADHLLTFHASRLPGDTPVIIRTNDHFGSCLADILKVYRKAFHAGNHIHLLEFILETYPTTTTGESRSP